MNEIDFVSITYMLIFDFLLVMLVKTVNTYNQRMQIINAIHSYNMHCIEINECSRMIGFEEMEKYEVTDWRLWDWGCTRILPPEKFELVKPYLQKGNNK